MTKSGEYEINIGIEARRLEDALELWHDCLFVRFAHGRHLTPEQAAHISDRLRRRRVFICESFRGEMLRWSE